MHQDFLKKFRSLKLPVNKGKNVIAQSYSPQLYRTLRFNAKELPEIKDWEVGNTYCVALKLRQVGKEDITTIKNDNSRISAEFEIQGIIPNIHELYEEKESKHNIAKKVVDEYSEKHGKHKMPDGTMMSDEEMGSMHSKK